MQEERPFPSKELVVSFSDSGIGQEDLSLPLPARPPQAPPLTSFTRQVQQINNQLSPHARGRNLSAASRSGKENEPPEYLHPSHKGELEVEGRRKQPAVRKHVSFRTENPQTRHEMGPPSRCAGEFVSTPNPFATDLSGLDSYKWNPDPSFHCARTSSETKLEQLLSPVDAGEVWRRPQLEKARTKKKRVRFQMEYDANNNDEDSPFRLELPLELLSRSGSIDPALLNTARKPARETVVVAGPAVDAGPTCGRGGGAADVEQKDAGTLTPNAEGQAGEVSSAEKIFQMEDFPMEIFQLNTSQACTLQVSSKGDSCFILLVVKRECFIYLINPRPAYSASVLWNWSCFFAGAVILIQSRCRIFFFSLLNVIV